MLYLKPLSLRLPQGLVVGHLEDDVCRFLSEQPDELLFGGFCIFDRVMENGGYQNAFILDASFIRQNIAEADGVIYVGGSVSVFTPLIAMLVSRERQCLDNDVHTDPVAQKKASQPS
jgi:hypothetical protein